MGVDERPDGELMLRTHFSASLTATVIPSIWPRRPPVACACRTAATPSCTSATSTTSTRSSPGHEGCCLSRITDESGIHHDSGVFSVDTSFESIIVFEDQAEIPRVDLARLSRCGWGHDLVAGVDRGSPPQALDACCRMIRRHDASAAIPTAQRFERTRQAQRRRRRGMAIVRLGRVAQVAREPRHPDPCSSATSTPMSTRNHAC